MEIKEVNQFHIEVLTQALAANGKTITSERDKRKEELKKALADEDYSEVSHLGDVLDELSAKSKGIKEFHAYVKNSVWVGQDMEEVDWFKAYSVDDLIDAIHNWMVHFANDAVNWKAGVSTKENAQLLVAGAQIIYVLKTED